MQRKLEFWIITSTEDIASMNIRTHLLEEYPFHQVEDNSDEWSSWEGNPTYLLKAPEVAQANIRLVLTNTAMVLLGDNVPKEDLSTFIGADFVIFLLNRIAKQIRPRLELDLRAFFKPEPAKYAGY